MRISKGQMMMLTGNIAAFLLVTAGGILLGNRWDVPGTALGVGLAALSMWTVAVLFTGGENRHSTLAMFQSQWQVPLYAAGSVYLATVLGIYLKSLGAEAACGGWPLCGPEVHAFPASIVAAHYVHRAAAGLAGLFLLYTVSFVWRRHSNRPALLVLTACSVVLYTVQGLLGARAAELALTPLGSVAHLAVATALVCLLVVVAATGYYAPSLPAIAGGSAAAAAMPLGEQISLKETARAYFATMKPGVLLLLLVTGYFGMWVAAKGLPSIPLTLVTMLGLGMSCGAANAINMWWDQDIDAVMNRTKKRPIPTGKLAPGQVLAFGVMTGALSFVLLAAAVNLLTAVLAMAGLLFYVLIYTMWLKRSTVQNIVIGGAAGAIPPLVGWAAVTGEMSWAGWVMFAIIFMWTPPHFWALALYRNDDYRRANVPMMPVVKGEMRTKTEIVIYALLLIPTAMSLYWTGVVGKLYLWTSLAVSVWYFASTVMLYFERLPEEKWAKKSFKWSLYYLTLIFLVMAVDVVK